MNSPALTLRPAPGSAAGAGEPGRPRDEALVLALDATLTSIWDYNVTADQVTLDANWSRMLGGPATTTHIGLPDLFAQLHPDDQGRASRATLACLVGRTADYSQEYRVRDIHGEWMWVHSRGRVTDRDARGRATRLIGTNIDISQRKTSELAASRESEELFKGVFNASPIPIILLTFPEGRIRAVNHASEQVFGYRPDEVIGRTTLELNVWPDPERRKGFIEQLRAGGTIQTIELVLRRKDGVLITVLYNVARIAIGDQPCMLASVIDITGQKQAEAALRKSEAALRQAQKMESLGTLAGGIAHDFNNILTGILGYAQLGLSDLPPGHSAAQWLEGILKSGERAKDLVHQILTFSRRTEISRSPMRLQLIVRESLSLLRSTIPAMVRIEHHLDPGCPPVLADHTEIHQVILNLCTNAWHALPATGGLIEVSLAPQQVSPDFASAHPPLKPGMHVHLVVRDNGRGMSAAVIERIFEPFFTTKDAGKGTGLGLAVVHSIVAAHEGAIQVESAPGEGTRFDVYFPTVADAPAAASVTANPFLSPPGRGEAVLVVDDESASGTVIASVIGRLGYRTTLCADPAEALALLKTNDFSLLVTDLAMPGMPGDELARQVLGLRPALPILLLSGFIEPATTEKLRGLGVKEVLGKPPTPDELAAAIKRCLPA